MEVKKDNSNAADSIQSYRPARSALLPASNAGFSACAWAPTGAQELPI